MLATMTEIEIFITQLAHYTAYVVSLIQGYGGYVA